MIFKILKGSHRQWGVLELIKRVKNLLVSMNAKTELNIFDLPTKNIRVKLKAEFRKKILENLVRKYGSFAKISARFRLKKGEKIRHYFITERSGIPLETLFEISKDINIAEKEIQTQVIEMKTLKSTKTYKPIFPIKLLTSDFGLIVGGILGDGGIDGRTKRPFYYSTEPEQIESFKKAVLKTFGKTDFMYHRSIAGVPCIMFPKVIGEILCIVGLEEGNKNYKHHQGIPKIFSSRPKTNATISLIRRLYDDDGTVARHKCNRGIDFIAPTIFKENEKIIEPKILLDLKTIFQEFGIQSYIYNSKLTKKPNSETTCYWQLRIRSKKNIQIFYEKIGFGLQRKQTKVKEVLEMYVDGLEFYPRFHANENYLSVIRQMENERVKITTSALAKSTHRNSRHIREVLLGLTKANAIKRELIGNMYSYHIA